MRKLFIFLMCVLIINIFACTSYIKPQKTEINSDLLEELSRDLAEINLMVENARKEYPEELLTAKVIEPWNKSKGAKFSVVTASKLKRFDVIAKSKIEVPTAKGLEAAVVLKYLPKGATGNYKALYVAGREEMFNVVLGAASKETVTDDFVIRIYDPGLAYRQEAVDAIKQYISITSRLEKTANKILQRLTELKNKYLNSPVYIEGFNISFPLISVEIQFKFK